MANWRDRVLREFPSQVARLTLVADPDGLLTEEGILRGLRERGFDLIPFDDPIEFRYAYESRYRAQWDRGATTDLVVVLRSQARELESLPYDLCEAGRKIAFDLTDIFPNLSYPVVDALNRSHFDTLYEAQQQYNPSRLGDNQSKDFILLHVFEIEPKVIKHPAHLLHVLLRMHYGKVTMPSALTARLVQVLHQGGQFEDWPLEQIVSDRAAFFEFMQERWALFVRYGVKIDEVKVKERPDEYGLKFPGPSILPFDHDDVRVYLDNLFAEGLMQPVATPTGANAVSAPAWVSIGLSLGGNQNALRRLDGLVAETEGSIPKDTAPHQEWLAFAHKWAELQAVRYRMDTVSVDRAGKMQDLGAKKDEAFHSWMLNRYGGLYNQPPDPPVMVHHIPRALSCRMDAAPAAKVAFVLVDGLSMGQWCVVRDTLKAANLGLRFDERAVFAWVPTLTSVSRQAAFSGKIPQFFPDSMTTTAKDEAGWRQFWLKHGMSAADIGFVGPVGAAGMATISAATEQECRVLGAVIGTVDDIMHGMQLGLAGMHSQVEQWARTGAMAGVLQTLVQQGWQVFIGADHGNIEAKGVGAPSEGVLVETRGQRVRVYETEPLRDKTAQAVAGSWGWPPVGLPPGYYPLMTAGSGAFTTPGVTIVAHGGASLEEVIVPFIRVYA